MLPERGSHQRNLRWMWRVSGESDVLMQKLVASGRDRTSFTGAVTPSDVGRKSTDLSCTGYKMTAL